MNSYDIAEYALFKYMYDQGIMLYEYIIVNNIITYIFNDNGKIKRVMLPFKIENNDEYRINIIRGLYKAYSLIKINKKEE